MEQVRHGRTLWNVINGFNCILCLLLILFIVGFSCPEWSHLDNAYYSRSIGLWDCSSQFFCAPYSSDEFKATQFFECIALIADILASVGVAVFYYCLYRARYSNSCNVILKIIGSLAWAGGASGTLGCIIFSAYVGSTQDSLGWAFILTIIASIFIALLGCGQILISTPRFLNLFTRDYENILGS